jgi:outer membrane receptor protein involved in Fe transport
MNKLIVLIVFVFSVNLQAQQVTGKVCMQTDKSPAQFASVGLLQLPDSGIVSGVITLTDGAYTFESVKPGEYLVKVSFMGYANALKNISVKSDAKTVVDTIFLTEAATSLQEVTVVGERLKGKELVDRTTYNIPPLVAKSSTNGYELLKKIPQVNVDFQNNVTLNGSSNFIIQVDGRQRDKEFLAKLLPSDIETIEIISNPSGKYEGNIDGVINIILKKEARYGMNGNVGFNIKPINKLTYSGTGSLDYSMGKITFYITGFKGGQNLHISSSTRTSFKMLDSISNAYGSGDIKVGFANVNTGFDYYVNDKNNISFNVSYRPIRQDIDMISNTDLVKNNSPLDTLSSITGDLTKSDEATFSLFHKKTFKKPIQEFTSETSYYIFRSNQNSDFENRLKSSETNIYGRKELDHNERDYFSVKLNYVQPFGMNTKLEAGYQLYFQDMNYNFTINDTSDDNRFKYAELRNSVYAGLTFNLKKFGFQTTLRAENSHINADSVTSPDYTCLLPSVNIQYKFSASHNIKLTYNRRINRPGIYDMNPYEKIGQNYDVSVGNPDLRPDYRDRLQLTYTWNFGSNYFSPNVYYESLSNKVGRRSELIKSPVDGSYTTFTKPYNLLSGYEYGGGVNAMLWFVNINGRIYQGHYDKYQKGTFTIPERDYFSYSLTSYAYAPLDKAKKTTAFAFLQYNGVNIDAQTKTYSLAFYGLGAQKQIKDHSIGFVWLLPLSSNVDLNRTETETDYYHVRNIIGFDVAWFIQVMYSYKFNKGKNVKKIGHKVDVESDSKSQGIGM